MARCKRTHAAPSQGLVQSQGLTVLYGRTMKTLLVLLLMWHSGVVAQGPLRLVDNGYEGLLISISDLVPQDHCNQIIHGIKSVLTEFSSRLWTATSGRASLRTVTVALPRNWRTNTLTCSLLQSLSPAVSNQQAHIFVTTPSPVFGSRPWTQQSRGCGRQGDYISLSGDSLRASTNDSHVRMAKLLLAEWAKFRWGVFEEYGHPSDPLYPPFYRDAISHQYTVSLCSNQKVKGTPAICDPAYENCHFTPEVRGNSHIISSILAIPELPSVKRFCDDKTHTREAPTKHNALCGGRSTWEIIMQTQDFLYGRNPPTNTTRALEPTFRFVKSTNPRYALVIEDTAAMNIQRRWEFLRKAVRRCVVYDVPDGSKVSVVTFNSVAKTVAPLTFIESEDSDFRQRVGSSLPRNPSSVPESHKCILCGLQEAFRTLQDDSEGIRGANIILITSGSGAATPQQMKEILNLVTSNGIRFVPVLYPLAERPGPSPTFTTHGLEPLIEAAGGHAFTVMDEGVGNDSKVKMMVALMDALLSAVQMWGPIESPGGSPGSPVLVHNAAYPGGITSVSTGAFSLDDSLGPDARFSVYYYDLNHVGNSIQLKSPSGTTMASVNMQEEDGDVNMIFVNIERAERGIWTYSVENRADSHQGLYIQVTARRNSSLGVTARLWTSVEGRIRAINASDPSAPVILYAEVKDGNSPVLNAHVVARLQRLGTNATGSTYKPIQIELIDNGVGDPDLTHGDGVYSRYLPSFNTTAGRYLLSVDIDHNSGSALVSKGPPTRHHKVPSHVSHYYTHGYDNWGNYEPYCCGSKIRYLHTRRCSPFHRHVTWGVIEVISPAPIHDTIPPTRIRDLRALVNETDRRVTLRWTSPGDDYDFGRAHHYEAVLAPSWRQARAFQGERLKGLPRPLPVGTLHVTNFHFTRYEELWYITVRAVDESGNFGGRGNVAALWVPRPPTTYEITTRTQPGVTTSGNYSVVSELGSGRPYNPSELRFEDVAVILGSIGGFLLVVAILVAYCYCHTVRRRKQQQQKDAEKLQTGGNVMIKSGSCPIGLDDSEGQSGEVVIKEGESSTEIRPLSPVQSWGASKLLQEHERRFSVNSSSVTHDDPQGGAIEYQPDSSLLPAPFPDVTVTDYRPCSVTSSVAPTPTSSTTLTTATYNSGDLTTTAYHPYPMMEGVLAPYQGGPAPEYSGYPTSWEEPLTGHLLSRARTGPPVTAASVTSPPLASPSPCASLASATSERKRRNVTQV